MENGIMFDTEIYILELGLRLTAKYVWDLIHLYCQNNKVCQKGSHYEDVQNEYQRYI